MDQAFTDPEWGASTAKQALDQNADVVFGAGGKTGNGALIEVANAVGADGPPPFCIGVDTDQWFTVPEAHPLPGVERGEAAGQGCGGDHHGPCGRDVGAGQLLR
ncbi:MAG: BMP family ABC transporter substrate-binding protein [Thermoleophilia bacterium]|nr:BMP family ABC transporter substrate-binding protein [Thermoleophilia bacterium]